MFLTRLFPIIGFIRVYKCYTLFFIMQNNLYIIAQSLPNIHSSPSLYC